MDSAELEGSSSSQSAKTITEIVQGAGRSVQIRFSDGSSFFVRPRDVRHSVGDTVTETEIERLAAATDIVPAKMKAMDILASHDHSRWQLTQKLKKRGYSDTTIEYALKELEQEQVIDDFKFAVHWADERLRRHPESSSHLAQGLIQRGIDRHTAADAVAEVANEDTERDALERAAEKLMRKRTMTPERFMRSLASRGFSASSVYRARDKYFPKSLES